MMSLTAKEINKNIRHDIADTLTSYSVEWTGLHDNVIDGPIHQHILPLVDEIERLTMQRDNLLAAVEEFLTYLDNDQIVAFSEPRYTADEIRLIAKARAALEQARGQ